MKRILAVLLTMILLFAMMSINASAETEEASASSNDVTINVYNWGQYIADGSEGSMDILAEFTRRTGIKVNYMTYDTNETMYTRLKNGGSSFDVIIPSDYMVGRLIEEDMLEKIDYSNIPNYQYINDSFKNLEYDPNNEYSVPYSWGSVGIIYNTKYVTKPVTGWEIMWDNDYKDKIFMFDNSRDAFAIAQFELGIDINTTDEAELESAAELLKEQNKVVQQYGMDQVFLSMQNEESWIAAYYAGDYLTMVAENPDLAFCFPEEGFNRFVDAMCIPKGCQHKAEAEAFINFMTDPEICGANMDFIGYSAPSDAAKEYVSPECAQSDVAYPDEETLSRGVTFSALPNETLQIMDAHWLDIKAAGGNGFTGWLIFAGVAVVVIAVIILFVVKKRKKNKFYDEM